MLLHMLQLVNYEDEGVNVGRAKSDDEPKVL